MGCQGKIITKYCDYHLRARQVLWQLPVIESQSLLFSPFSTMLQEFCCNDIARLRLLVIDDKRLLFYQLFGNLVNALIERSFGISRVRTLPGNEFLDEVSEGFGAESVKRNDHTLKTRDQRSEAASLIIRVQHLQLGVYELGVGQAEKIPEFVHQVMLIPVHFFVHKHDPPQGLGNLDFFLGGIILIY